MLLEQTALHEGRLSHVLASPEGHLRGSDRWTGQPGKACTVCTLTRRIKEERVIE